MGLQKVFTKGVNTVFNVLNEAVHEGQYIAQTDDGWGNTSEASYPVRVILDQFKQEDVEFTSFYELIQPTDTKGLIPGEDITVAMKTSNIVQIGERTFTIVAFETDPMQAMFTLLLRDT